MTTDRAEYQHANLAFFRDFVFGSSIGEIEFEKLDAAATPTPILKSKGLIEAALWMKLGVEVGFLDPESVSQFLITCERPLSVAWNYLLDQDALAGRRGRPPDVWCDFMSDEPQARLIKDKFFEIKRQKIGPLKRLSSKEYDHLSQCFLGCLLLTSEVIFEPCTMVFLEKIGWASNEEWNYLTQGDPKPSGFRIEDLYIGLANYVRYSKQLFEHLSLYIASDIGGTEFVSLKDKAWKIHSERRLIIREYTDRLLPLVAKIVNRLPARGLEWRHARLAIFKDVYQITGLNRDELFKRWV